MESARPTWSSTPHPPAETFAACLPLLAFSVGTLHLAGSDGQDLRLSRTVIGAADRGPAAPYVDRFACDWHRLAGRFRAGVQHLGMSGPGPARRNHGPRRTPYTDVSGTPLISVGDGVCGWPPRSRSRRPAARRRPA